MKSSSPVAEVMISLSRLIRSRSASLRQEKKIISVKKINLNHGTQCKTSERELELPNSHSEKEAEKMIDEAKSYAEAIKKQIEKEKARWEEEKKKLIDESKLEGFMEGVREGREKGYQEINEQLQIARKTVELSKQDYREKLESSEQTILALGLKVAEKILSEKVEGNPEQFIPLVKRVLKEAREYKEVQLHINPVHYDGVLSQRNELLKIFPRETEFYVYPDDALPEGGCIIESPNGRIDATIDHQLEEIKKKLFALLESE